MLALRDFESDNSDYDRNWEYEIGKGSPGEMNPNYLPWKNRSESASDGGQNLQQFLRSVRVGLWILGGFFIFALIYIAIKTLLKRKNREDKTS